MRNWSGHRCRLLLLLLLMLLLQLLLLRCCKLLLSRFLCCELVVHGGVERSLLLLRCCLRLSHGYKLVVRELCLTAYPRLVRLWLLHVRA